MDQKKVSYRAEIDGLRAIAVTPVVLFHAGVPYFQGGFIGVDVFFVISGYLITSIIVNDLNNDRFTLWHFYERRVRRILPALYTVLLFCAVMAIVTMDPRLIGDLAASLLSTLGFTSNVYFWQTSGYFGETAELRPLLHTWSLSVEEQYYVAFPILLSLGWFMGRCRIALVLIVGAIVSLGIAEWGWRNSGVANFFLTPSRAWELSIGALVALAPIERWRESVGPSTTSAVSVACLAVLATCFVLFGASSPHPGFITLIPVLATAGIIVFCEGGGMAGAILTWRYVVGIGLLSYSLYLWHQPVFVFARFYSPEALDSYSYGFLVLLSFGAAYLSWRFVEKPFRNPNFIAGRSVFILAVVTSCIGVGLSVTLMIDNELPLRKIDPESFERYQIIGEASPSKRSMVNSGCHIWSETFTREFKSSFDRCSKKHGRAIFITGGSHGMDLYNAIARNSSHPFIASVSQGYCRPHRFLNGRAPHRCHYEDLVDFASERSKMIEVILYTQTPDRLFNVKMDAASPEDLSIPAVKQTVDYLGKLKGMSGVNVAIIGMLPPLLHNPSDFNFRRPLSESIAKSFSPRLVDLTRHVDKAFARSAETAGLPYVAKIDAFKLRLPSEIMVNGQLMYSDRRHLTVQGELRFGKRLVSHLTDLQILPRGP